MKILILSLITLIVENSFGQNCVADYFYINYKGEYSQKINRTIRTPQNDLLSIGSVFYAQNGMYFTDGWITKMTAQGSVIWSKRYNNPRHNVITFSDIIPASDSTYFVLGSISYLGDIDTIQYSKEIWGILLHIDMQGKLLWSKQLSARFNPFYDKTGLQSIIKTRDGDFIVSAIIRSNLRIQATMLIIRINAQGKIKWTSTVTSSDFLFEMGLNKILQLNNGNILVAGLINQRTNQGFNIPKVGYNFLNLDYVTGAKIWGNSYLFINKPSFTYFATTESLRHIEEQPNGDLSFIAYTTDSSALSTPPYTSKSVNIATDASGNLKKVISYDKGQFGTYPVAALNAGNGEKLVLIDDGDNAPLIRINNAGQILKKKAYNVKATLAPVSLNFATSGYYIFLNDRGPYGGNSYLMKVDSTASIDCKEGSAQLFANDVTSLFVSENTLLNVKASDADTVLFSLSYTENYNYPLEANTECIKACCKDVMDTVVTTTLCEGSIYTLPDGYAVKDSGTYYISYKTAKGCDSVAFYHILFIKNPASLRVKGDECFAGKDTILLKATSGFERYNWVNNITADSSYSVIRPGIYWVGVSNSCGVNRDSIEIFDQCEFPIYIPTAFTPDGNGLNDVFRVPPENKNKFKRLQVYNRWGQKIFETKDISKGWDGKFRGKLQPTGVYIYLLNMESLKGNQLMKQGTITLIR